MAVVYLTCVLEDGTGPRSKIVPPNTSTTLTVSQGANTTVIANVVTPAGVPVTDGDLRLRVRKSPDAELVLDIPGSWQPTLGLGTAIFTITSAQVSLWQWGRYLYDVQRAQGDALDLVMPVSPFVLQPAV